jgi:ATP phosphoribosyltransferase regulatory subunit
MEKEIMKAQKAKLQRDEIVTLELRGLYEQVGYRKYKMGRFEEYQLYVENKDFLGSDKVISFTDLDGRLLALKPDVTLSIIKNSKATRDTSEKLYYIENVYRESKESHTYQEIHQMGLEFIGDVDRYGVVEVLALAAQSLESVSRDYILEISHMNYVVEFLNELNITENIKHKLLRLIRNKNVSGLEKTAMKEDLPQRENEVLLAIPYLYGDIESTIKKARALAISPKMLESVEELEEVLVLLKAAGYSEKCQVDFSMVNDIDYYNGIVFRGYVKELARLVLAGGQYDLAMKRFGKDVDAIGFALYLNEVSRINGKEGTTDVDSILLYEDDADLKALIKEVHRLQKKGLKVWVGRNLPRDISYKDIYRWKVKGLVKMEKQVEGAEDKC